MLLRRFTVRRKEDFTTYKYVDVVPLPPPHVMWFSSVKIERETFNNTSALLHNRLLSPLSEPIKC